MNYCLQCNCSENSRQKVRCSRRCGWQNESWLSVCAVTAWRKNRGSHPNYPSSNVAAGVDGCESAAYLVG